MAVYLQVINITIAAIFQKKINNILFAVNEEL